MDYIQELEEAGSHEDKLYKILDIYMNLFPVKNSFLFRYSHLGYLGEGIISINQDGLAHIRDLRDDIRSLPVIYSALYERKAKYCSGIEFLKQITSKYILPSNVDTFLAVPICFDSVSIGYICSYEFKKGTMMTDQLLASFTNYGRQVGKVLEKTTGAKDTTLLSRRELEVMKRISWGESTKEVADALSISEVTINQYVKSAVKKLGAQNRVQAVATLFRKGIIS
ncbi:response regulator transcription factor [Bacillus sp. EB01]|uniref:response regulator transcription factor n=1 Tax=Bacillus sp. EB01 TaxID=1347086 RepID=UPI001E342C17|nr:helix-turn-helix transcriptional regulator [Bacillus sp. EB01]